MDLLWFIRAIVSIAAISFAAFSAQKAFHKPDDPKWKLIIAAVWALAPPVWFILEFNWLFPFLNKNANKDTVDNLKHGQSLAGALWLGIGSLLLAIYQVKSKEGMACKAEGDVSQKGSQRGSRKGSQRGSG